MKASYISPFLLALGLSLGTVSCSDDKLDEISTNPNDPTTVSVRLLLPQVQAVSAFSITGTDMAWHSSLFTEHSAGVHAQFEQVDKRNAGSFIATTTNNDWDNLYSGVLKDLNIIIEQGSTGREAGAWRYVGIAKILKAYNLAIATDLFGRIPNSEALQAPAILKPKYDTQQSVYESVQKLLDEAIIDLDKTSTAVPTNDDLFFAGSAAAWKKVAYSLKARYYNHLSKRDPQNSASQVIANVGRGFTSEAESFTFSKFTTSAIGENPWFQERNDRSHFAVSKTFYDILVGLNDPRRSTLVGTVGSAATQNPAPNGATQNDQGGTIYSRASTQLVNATAPLPLMSYAELKFVEAEAQLRLNKNAEAYAAYLAGIRAAMARQFVSTAAIDAYLAQPSIGKGAAALTLRDIIVQKYIAAYIYSSIESYTDYRRTGFPELKNTQGTPPRRFPYPQSEFDSNRENVPSTDISKGVWWDDGTED
jgi:Starch-binding associating with outer membrane